MLEATEERKVKVKQNNNSNLNHLPLTLSRKNIMKTEITTITMRIIGVIIEAIGPKGANIISEDHTEGLSKGEGDNKITIEANFKATMGNLILLVVTIIIIIYGNYHGRGGREYGSNFHRPHGHRRGNNNYQYHQYYTHDDGTQFEKYGPPCTLCGGFNHSPKHCYKGEHSINNLMEKMSLGSNSQHQNGFYQ